MSSTATTIIAIIAGIAFLYPIISFFVQFDANDPDDINSSGPGKYSIRDSKGELVEVDFNKKDGEQVIRFLSVLLEKK
ncbi:hypothetical protein SAMN05518672_11283 [Chitinophaga sp. CF118]|uniref:hypothetical protein n=1 Tax=Chitinophaga sp. CF118 TaxID=1884367 RepID=UPI0008F111EC|nr:hypothetical protein [Chitinophaga sp. CF118]SFE92596.1 hypothetical protein SAMN05518672_11283 [Chitinophaga sp. CF118]